MIHSTLCPQRLLDAIAPAVADVLQTVRVGVALREEDLEVFRVLALWDRRDEEFRGGATFPIAGTAGGWACETRIPLIGHDPKDLRSFEQTHDYLLREKLSSNLVLPLEFESWGRGVLYFLSRAPATFTWERIAVANKVREVVEPAIKAYLAAYGFVHGGRDEKPSTLQLEGRGLHSRYATLAEAQRRHIASVLGSTNGIVDGPRGAAKILGLHPSTLRNRMRKLGL